MRCPALSELPPPPPGRSGWPWTEESPQFLDTMSDGSPWPPVSIVTPSYNQGQFVEETIRSVLLQGYPNLEYIIMDGGSADGSVDIIRKYEPWLAYWVSERDSGQAQAINKGWRQSTGDVLAWMNSDDGYLPGALGLAVSWLASHPGTDVVFGACLRVDEGGDVIDQPVLPPFEYLAFVDGFNDYIPSGSTFIRRRVVERLGGLDESLRLVMDWDYWLRAGLVCSFGQTPEVLSVFRIYPQAKTWSREMAAVKGAEIVRIHENLFSRADLPAEVRALRRNVLSKAYLAAVRYAQRGEDTRSLRRYLWKAMRCGPAAWSALRPRTFARAILGRPGVGAFRAARLWGRQVMAKGGRHH
ncbi:MAG: glycosyltransferase [Chloroflexi bacterium]|nr:glycosyltransferase [Chloroflexota bacterium]